MPKKPTDAAGNPLPADDAGPMPDDLIDHDADADAGDDDDVVAAVHTYADNESHAALEQMANLGRRHRLFDPVKFHELHYKANGQAVPGKG